MTLHLHSDDTLLFMRLTIVARKAAEHFGLKLNELLPLPEESMKREYEHGVRGRCWTDKGVISIALRFQSDGKWLGRRACKRYLQNTRARTRAPQISSSPEILLGILR